jgi:hypothetical protein
MIMAIIEALTRLMKRIPGWVWLAVGGLLVGAFWLQQHDARIRQQAQLQQVRQQTSAQVAALERKARQDVRQANEENAQAIQKLEARRQQMERQNRQLAAQLASLRKQAQVQADQVATLPITEIVTRVAAQLGLKAEDVAPSAEAVAALAGKHCLPERRPLEEKNRRSQTAATKSGGEDTAATRNAALTLTSSGARKVEAALVSLNACLAESRIEDQQVSNCQARAQAGDATIARLNGSVASLNQALDAKDTILEQQAAEYKAELRAARGTFLGRLAHVSEHVAIGVAVGVAIGVVVR